MSFSSEDFAKALEQHDYQFQVGQVVRGRTFSHDANGAYVDIGGKSTAFLPEAEASLKRGVNLAEAAPLEEEREFLVIRDQDADGQVLLSIRRLEAKQLWEDLAEMQENAQTLQAKVTGVNKGGVTADVYGLRGFIPRSHLVERNDLDSLIGQTLTVSLLEVAPDRNKLVLSHRLARQAASLGRLEIGQLIEGKISGIKPFGVFVDFEGTTGLLHINQVSKEYVASLSSVFEAGQPIKAVIVDLDDVKKRISLSTKVLENYPGEILENQATVMAEAADRAEKARKNIENRGVAD